MEKEPGGTLVRDHILDMAAKCGILFSPSVAELVLSMPDPYAYMVAMVRDIEKKNVAMPVTITEDDVIQWVKKRAYDLRGLK
jgi:hypothetical protein